MKRFWIIFVIVCLIIMIIAVVYKETKKDRDTSIEWIKPVNGNITSSFGNRIHPIDKTVKFHNGVDISAPTGTKIKAPMDGIVTNVWEDSLNGLAVKIKHTNGWTTGYAHLSSQSVNKAQEIKQGNVIGAVGSTGKSTGPHLHLTLRDDTGAYSDPEKSIYV